MYGFDAINAANGWLMAAIGFTIVFMGLVVLSTLIANLERALHLWDRRGEIFRRAPAPPVEEAPAAKSPARREEGGPPVGFPVVRLADEDLEAAEHFQLIIERLGEPFSLTELLERAERLGISHPHRRLDTLLHSGLIIEEKGDFKGFYRWRKDARIVPSSMLDL